MIKAKMILWILKGIPKDGFRRKLFILKTKNELDKILKDGDNMEEKSKFQSKTFWVAIVGVVLGAIQPISTAIGHPVIVPPWIYEVLAGLGLYALRDGIGKPLQ